MRSIAAVEAGFVLLGMMGIEGQAHHAPDAFASQLEGPTGQGAAIMVVVNPEARISAVLTGAPLPKPHCGMAAALAVKIVNQGGVTSQLAAELVVNRPRGTILEFRSEPLTGVSLEVRKLFITLNEPTDTDITIAFRLNGRVTDSNGRDRVYFVTRCT